MSLGRVLQSFSLWLRLRMMLLWYPSDIRLIKALVDNIRLCTQNKTLKLFNFVHSFYLTRTYTVAKETNVVKEFFNRSIYFII